MYLQVKPHPALAPYVRLYRVLHFDFTASSHPIPHKPYPPRPETCLSFYPRDPETIAYPGDDRMGGFRASLYGKQSLVTNRYVGRDFLLIQVVFHPTGLFRLTGIPAHSLTNAYVDAEGVFGKEIIALNTRLSGIADARAMLPHIEACLMSWVHRAKKSAHPLDTVSGLMLQPQAGHRLDWLARESCLSPKQFERQFLQRIGLTPKSFARIVRFDRAFRLKNAQPGLDWLSIALQCGYYDYQHLAKDYKAFTNQTPTAFYEQDTQAPERHFGIQET